MNASEQTGFLSTEKKILPSAPDGHAKNWSSKGSDEGKTKKKKCVMISIAATVALIAIIGIILGVVLNKNSGDDPDPEPPTPPGPIPPDAGVNPYNFIQDDTY